LKVEQAEYIEFQLETQKKLEAIHSTKQRALLAQWRAASALPYEIKENIGLRLPADYEETRTMTKQEYEAYMNRFLRLFP
jgi:hypothetical protein